MEQWELRQRGTIETVGRAARSGLSVQSSSRLIKMIIGLNCSCRLRPDQYPTTTAPIPCKNKSTLPHYSIKTHLGFVVSLCSNDIMLFLLNTMSYKREHRLLDLETNDCDWVKKQGLCPWLSLRKKSCFYATMIVYVLVFEHVIWLLGIGCQCECTLYDKLGARQSILPSINTIEFLVCLMMYWLPWKLKNNVWYKIVCWQCLLSMFFFFFFCQEQNAVFI